ncbi:MAG: glutathionylspermidine synthase family protein [Bacteroidia bacterium]
MPIPLFEEKVQVYEAKIKVYVELLHKVVRLYDEQEIVRKFLGFPQVVDRIIRNSIAKDHGLFFARLDGYIDAHTGKIKFLENNSDAPAGTLFTPRINNMSIRFMNELEIFKPHTQISEFTFQEENSMLNALQKVFEDKFSRTPRTLVIFQIRNQSNRESIELSQLSTQTFKVYVTDPRDVRHKSNSLYTIDGEKIDLIWNKINTVYWNRLVEESPELLSLWDEMMESDSDFIHFNPFCYRYITENKLFASLLYAAEFEQFFTSEELAIRDTFIPVSYKIGHSQEVQYNNETHDLHILAQGNRKDFVLKEPYDIRGDGVTIGVDCDAETWKIKLEEVLQKGGILQEYIKPQQLPFFHDFQETNLINMNFHIDTFLFGNKLLGFGAKASTNHKVNIFQGGIKVPIIVFK